MEYDNPEPISSFQIIPTEVIPIFSSAQPTKDTNGKKKMFEAEDSMITELQETKLPFLELNLTQPSNSVLTNQAESPLATSLITYQLKDGRIIQAT